jgi:hypothetical protein
VDGIGRLSFEIATATVSLTRYTATTMSPLPLSQWSHVAVTVKSGQSGVKLYLNAALLGGVPTTAVSGHAATTGPLLVGRDLTSTYYWKGCLDGVEILRRARAAGNRAHRSGR